MDNKLTIIKKLPSVLMKNGNYRESVICRCECGFEHKFSLKYATSRDGVKACNKCITKFKARGKDAERKNKKCKCGEKFGDHQKCKNCLGLMCVKSICTKPSPNNTLCECCYLTAM